MIRGTVHLGRGSADGSDRPTGPRHPVPAVDADSGGEGGRSQDSESQPADAPAGVEHYSIGTLAHVVRWHADKQNGPDASGFKVNDIYLSRLSRWLMDNYPDEAPPECHCHKKPRPYS